eukprot:scaffold47194_cov58-Phaeocystis_antarctica.AAC.1
MSKSSRLKSSPSQGMTSPLWGTLDSFRLLVHSYTQEDTITRGFPPSAGCIGSFISSREPQPTMQPLGHVGSSAGGGAASPKLHWHSCVSKLGETRSGRPRLPKSSCAGSLHELRQMPLQLDSCRNLHFSTTSPPRPPSERRLTFAGPTRKPKAYGDTSDVSRGA